MSPNFHVKITRVGWLFISLCLGVGLSALNTGNNLLYLIFSMMMSFLILSGLLSNNTLRKLTIVARFPARIFAMKSVPVRLELENRKRLFPSYSLLLSARAGGTEPRDRPFVIKIPPHERHATVDHMRFFRRGRQTLPAYQVESTYPFGLIRKYIVLPSEGETVVYPRLLDVRREFDADRRLFGEFLSGQSGGSTNPYGIRDYVYGDSARLIHWKSSAKSGDLKVKEFEREKKRKVLLDVRLRPRNESDPAIVEQALSAAASLLLLLSENGYETVLRLNGEIAQFQGRGYLDAYLTALALAEPPEGTVRMELVRETDTLVLVTDRPEEEVPDSCLLKIGRKELELL